MPSDIALSLHGLSKTFGTVVANKNVSLDLYRGEVLSLLGENGAGKSTLMNMLFGHYQPDTGHVKVTDQQGQTKALTLGQPQAAIAAGIGMVHQHFTLAENLTALDNIMLGAESLGALKRGKKAARKKVEHIMQGSGLLAPLDVAVGQLTVGERQRVEILKALYRDVNILVLDEPTAVLTPQEADSLFDNIRQMTSKGLSVIFISHKLREVLAFSDRIVVLRHGEKVGELVTAEADEQTIARMMVGADAQFTKRDAIGAGATVLELKDINVAGRTGRDSLQRVNLSVHENEIVGIAGVSGNGQAALSGLVSGLLKPVSGEMIINDQPVKRFHPALMIKQGIACIPEDRHRDGIVGSMSVAENTVIERLSDSAIQAKGFLRKSAIRSLATQISHTYDVRGAGIDADARLLSGGNIQKLILARVFEREPKLIVANQPTRGLDMGAAAAVADRLLDARRQGSAIILISEDLDEVLNLSDRILIIRDGELIEAVSRERAELGLLMTGQAA